MLHQSGTSPKSHRLLRVAAAAAVTVTVSALLFLGALAPRAAATAVPPSTRPLVTRCADPGVTRVPAGLDMVCTSAGPNIPLYLRDGSGHWQQLSRGLLQADPQGWAMDEFWSPELHRVGAGYVLYYSARDRHGRHCIGAATSASLAGPYRDIGAPLVQGARIGVIDPTLFTDSDGRMYLYWKRDGNAVHRPSEIVAQALDATGLRLTGTPTAVLRSGEAWEHGVVEAPSVVRRGAEVYLFYSGGNFANGTYALGVARATSPAGPFTKDPVGPLIVSGSRWRGPGSASLIGDSDLVLNAFPAGQPHRRAPFALRLRWQGDWPEIAGEGID